MATLDIRSPESCRYDLVALGEVMLRLDPGESRVRTARSFQAWEGGGEYNVARGLRRCFGLRTAVVTGLVDNEVGRLLENLMLQGGVDLAFVQWFPFDGVGRSVRNGLNFTERGFGVRGAVGCSDRGHSAASQLQPDCVDWDQLFGTLGVRWFHTGGIFAALSATSAEVILAAVAAARRHGTRVSYDLNYRPSLWAGLDPQRARAVNQQIVSQVDLLLGNEEDFNACLGIAVAEGGATPAAYRRVIEEVVGAYPNLRGVAATLRHVHSATVNDWQALAWLDGGFHESTPRQQLEILDRVGGGDAFASGLIFGLLTGSDPERAVNYGAAHGALAMTTPGDTSMASLAEVEKLMKGGSARVVR